MTAAGRTIKLTEVARIEDTVADTETTTRVDGKPAVSLSVQKASGANTVDVADSIKSRIEELKGQFPPDLRSLPQFPNP